jgi:signal transduction histidine kinase/ActR/RegA family two-component response regulator
MEPFLAESVAVLASRQRDAELTCEFLRSGGISAVPCRDLAHLLEVIAGAIGAVMLTEEVLAADGWVTLAEALDKQPPWSDVPIVLFAGNRHAIADRLFARGSANLTIVETPVRVTTVLSAAKAALRARRRQYEVQQLVLRLEEADRRKDEFLAMLGHELRNPLTAVHTAVHLLRRQALPPAAGKPVDVIERQSRNLARIVDDLLDVSRVTLGKIKLDRTRVDLRDALQRCAQTLSPEASRSKQWLRVAVPSSPVIVDADLVRLEQVLANLVTNAIKYTPAGGHIELRLSQVDGAAVIEVCDDGIGIAPQMLPTIFELFMQVEQGLDRSRGGLGLGLALVRRLVELHGGTIEAHSDGPNTGSNFVVKLPALMAAQVATSEPAQAAPQGRRLRILVVEDNEDARDTLCSILEEWGHQVDAAADGLAGVEHACSSLPDVALVDIGLPLLDGFEVARQLHERLDGTCPRLIAMTGYGQPGDRQRAEEAGFDLHLVKPVDMAQLQRVLAETPTQ